ncbi:hypothetical protein VPH35_049882 [Triticum aestivum]
MVAAEDEGKPRGWWRYLVLILDLLFSTAWEHVVRVRGRGIPVQGWRTRRSSRARRSSPSGAHSSWTRQHHGHTGAGRCSAAVNGVAHVHDPREQPPLFGNARHT